MTEPQLLVHDVNHPTVTLFVDPGLHREEFLDEYPEEDGPVYTINIAAPEGIEVSPSRQSKLSSGFDNPDGEFILIAGEEGLQRASFDYDVVVPDRSYLDDETVSVTLRDHDDRVLDSANVLV